jgi:hypothetical protein
VEILGVDYTLREVWRDYFVPNLGELSVDLEPLLTGQLVRLHETFRATGNATDDWDPASMFRYRIGTVADA